MELVYLWVENYKSIRRQGFNFSSKYTFKFNDKYIVNIKGDETIKERCRLTYEGINYGEKFKYFFDENGKIHVTAIVGKNGSGKSSVLNILDDLFILGKQKHNVILVFDIKGELYYFSTFKILTELPTYNLNKIGYMSYNAENPYPYLHREKYHLYYTGMDIEYDKIIVHEHDDIESDELDEWNHIDIKNDKSVTFNHRQLLLKSIHSSLKNMEITSFMLVPYEFTIYNFNLAGFNAYVNEKLKKTIINDIIDLSDLTEYVLSEYSHAHIELFLLILDHLFDNDLIEKFSDDLIKKKIDEDTNLLMEEFIQETIDFYMNDINKIGTEPKDIYNIYIDGGFVISEESESIRDKILFTYSDFFIIDFKDEKNRMFSDLSHGEKAIYGLIVNLLYNIKNAGYNDFIFCLDEPDLSLHPEWQRKFLHELITSIKQENKDVHLISTTHSPFLLSDLPKHNILFLDKDDDGKCKVVDGLHEKKQTFGANIHTLLSDSFFMENGLIGDIAKEKIDKTISILNKNKYSEDELEYCENIISIIGEPIIKNQLQKLLDSKRLQKVDEIDTIKTDIEKLKQRLKELENDKN